MIGIGKDEALFAQDEILLVEYATLGQVGTGKNDDFLLEGIDVRDIMKLYCKPKSKKFSIFYLRVPSDSFDRDNYRELDCADNHETKDLSMCPKKISTDQITKLGITLVERVTKELYCPST